MVKQRSARLGIAARPHRPDHVVYIGWTGAVTHHHDPAADIADGSHLGRDQAHLRGVAEVALLHRDYAKGAAGARLVQPCPANVRYAGSLERVEQGGGTQEAALEQV